MPGFKRVIRLVIFVPLLNGRIGAPAGNYFRWYRSEKPLVAAGLLALGMVSYDVGSISTAIRGSGECKQNNLKALR